MIPIPRFTPVLTGVGLLALALGGCASMPVPTPEQPAAPVPILASTPAPTGTPGAVAAAGAAGARPPGEPPAPRPFADVLRDAKETKGFLSVWQKDEKIWLEIKPEQLDKPFFFGAALASGLGERFFLPGLMGQEQVVEFHKVGQTMQLVARNLSVRAPAGTPLETAVRESYSDSLLASAPI